MKKMLSIQLALLFGVPCAFLNTNSFAKVYDFYDASQNNAPQNQAWLTYYSNASSKPASTANSVNLQTTDSESAGFSNFLKFPPAPFPSLDSSSGFTLSFTMQLNAEDHSLKDSRAGFSVILLDENNLGVELGFWTDSIWSQSSSPLFNAKDEQVAFDTSFDMLSYDLTFLDSSYFLTQNNNLLLTGLLKDYSAFGLPYSLSNFLFLGDDTSSASADVNLGDIYLTDSALYSTNPPPVVTANTPSAKPPITPVTNPINPAAASVPVPSSISLMFLGLLGLIRYRRA